MRRPDAGRDDHARVAFPVAVRTPPTPPPPTAARGTLPTPPTTTTVYDQVVALGAARGLRTVTRADVGGAGLGGERGPAGGRGRGPRAAVWGAGRGGVRTATGNATLA